MKNLDETISEFVAASHRIARQGLIRCSSGNMSSRLPDGRMLISASRSWMGTLTREQVVVCGLNGRHPEQGPAPSVEIGFHAGILESRQDVEVVLHFQSPAATALACLPGGAAIDTFVLPEIPYYIGAPATVPYLPPGSPQLATAVTEAAAGHDMIVLRNHGQVTVGVSYEDVLQKAAFFELACDVILRTGRRAEPLSPEDAAALERA